MHSALTAHALWQSARAMLAELFFLIGAATPAALAQLKRANRMRVLAWLDALETMVRKLLLIEASAVIPSPRGEGAGGGVSHRTRINEAQASRFNVSRQEDHPAPQPPPLAGRGSKRAPTFALLPPEARDKPHPARIRLLGSATSVAEIWRDQERDARTARLRDCAAPEPGVRLANRIAALANVIANPIPHVRRLSRLMRRKAQTAARILIARLSSTPPDFHLDAYEAVQSGAERSLTPRFNSS